MVSKLAVDAAKSLPFLLNPEKKDVNFPAK